MLPVVHKYIFLFCHYLEILIILCGLTQVSYLFYVGIFGILYYVNYRINLKISSFSSSSLGVLCDPKVLWVLRLRFF